MLSSIRKLTLIWVLQVVIWSLLFSQRAEVLFCAVTFAMKNGKKINQSHEIASPGNDSSRSGFHSVLPQHLVKS